MQARCFFPGDVARNDFVIVGLVLGCVAESFEVSLTVDTLRQGRMGEFLAGGCRAFAVRAQLAKSCETAVA